MASESQRSGKSLVSGIFGSARSGTHPSTEEMLKYYTGKNESYSKRKVFRSRSFSFGSQRKATNANPETNSLLYVARSHDEESGGTQRVTERKSICDIFKRRNKVSQHDITVRKHKERKHTFLYGRRFVRYICSIIRFIGMVIIFIAFGLHLQYQWQMGNYSTEIIVVSTTAATTFAFVVVLYLFFNLRAFSHVLVHFWVSLALGVFFVQQTHLRRLNKAIMMCTVFSTGLRCLCSLVERIFRLPSHRSQFLSESEISDLLAFSLTCVLLPPRKCFDLWLEIASLGFVVMNAKMKAPLSLALTGLFVIVSAISVIGNLSVKTNKYSFVCFCIRLLWDPLLDLYFSGLHPLTRWKCFFRLSRMTIYPFLFGLFLFDVFFLWIALQAIPNHPKYEWPVFLPFITVSGLGWLAMHATYFAVQISFMQRIAACKRQALEEKFSEMSFQQTLSHEGIRAFSGICHGVTSGCVFLSGIFGAICWRRKDGTYPAMFVLLLSIESLSLALFAHLATNLRGKCYGYGIVASPSSSERKYNLVLPSSTEDIQTLAASRIMNAIQNFFRDQLIETLGCDCYSRGPKLSQATVEKKLGILFSKRTTTGKQPYDNYVVFFSGIADKEGSWLLADGGKLTLERILELWDDRPSSRWRDETRSRLVLISDAPNSKAWLHKVRKLDAAVVIQTCTYACDEQANSRPAVEEGWAKRGDFTMLWTSFLKSLQIEHKYDDEYIEDDTNDFIRETRAQGLYAKFEYSSCYLTSVLSPCNGDFSTHACTYCCLPVVIFASYLSKNLFSFVSGAPTRRLWFYIKAKCFGKSMWNLGEGFVLINS